MKSTLPCFLPACKLLKFLSGLIIAVAISFCSHAQHIITIAGTGTAGMTGDGGPATAATIRGSGIAYSSGNLYIAAANNYKIRKIDSFGIISTFAGTGISGYSGDGGPATAAHIGGLGYTVGADASGNVYIPDDYRIRKVSPSGIITTIAGTGINGFTGDGGPATAARIGMSQGIALDRIGNIYITMYLQNIVRKIDTAGIITTIAGNLTSGFSGDGGQATAAQLKGPSGVGVDSAGNIYINDQLNYRFRKVNTSGIISTVGGVGTVGYSGDGGLATAAQINQVFSTIVDTTGNVFVPDMLNNRLRIINPAGVISTFCGNGTPGFAGDGGPLSGAVIHSPNAITKDPAGNIYFVDGGNARIRMIVMNNRLVSFTSGLSTSLSVCANTSYDSLNSLLAATDPDTWDTLTWSMVSGPVHGTASVSYSVPNTGDTVTPHGLWYTPTSGYSGADSLRVRVTDGQLSDTITVYITVNTSPAAISGSSAVCIGYTTLYSDATPGGTWSSGSPGIATVGSSSGVVAGVAAGTAVITYTVPGGCFATKTVTVDATAPPITGIAATCIGFTTTLFDAGSGTWTSGSTGVATVGSSSGVVMGVSSGTSIITYTLFSGCTATFAVTVFPVPAAITGTTGLCVGAVSTLSDGVPGGYWYSSATGIAGIGSVSGVVSGLSAGMATITYSVAPNPGCMATTTVTVSPVPSIGGSLLVCSGATTTLTAGGSGTWTSGATGVASIGSSSGIVSGISVGTAPVTYTTSGCAASAVVTVSPGPSAISGVSHLCVGATTTLTDTVTGGTWSSGATGIATIGSASGVVTGGSAGAVMMTYTTSGCYATYAMTIDPLPAAITGLTHVCPGTSTPLTSASPGGTWTSSAMGIADVGSSSGILSGVSTGTAIITYALPTGCLTTTPVTVNPLPAPISGVSAICVSGSITFTDATPGGSWSRSNTNVNVGVATGIVTGVTVGTSVVTYMLPTGCYATLPVTVNAAPGPVTGTLGVCIGAATTLSDVTPGGVWTSTSPGIAAIGSSTGVVNGVLAGVSGITYSTGVGCSVTAVVTVNPLPAAFTVSGGGGFCPGGAGLHIGLTGSTSGVSYQLYIGGVATGSPVTGTGSPLDFGLQTSPGSYTVIATNPVTGCTRTMAGAATIVVNPFPAPISGPAAVCVGATAVLTDTGGGTWTSGSPSVATIGSASGIVTGVAIGTTAITYTLPTGCFITGSISVSVAPVPISGASNVCSGSSTLMTDAVGGGIWTTSNTAIATAGSLTGMITGVAAGTVTISYSLGSGCTVTKAMTVNTGPSAIGGTMTLCVGSTSTLSSSPAGGTWTSGATGIATVGSASGIVSGAGAGSAVITYTGIGGCSVTATVTVNLPPPAITGLARVCPGTSSLLSVASTGGVWTSSNTAVATIGSASGLLAGVTTGTVTVTYSIGSGCMTTTTATVNPLPGAITGSTQVCMGSTITLSDAVGGGSWSSSSTGIAIVGSVSGVVTGVSTGIVTISYTLPTGCFTIKTVTVGSLPASITGSNRVCVGLTTTLSDATTGGTWSSASTGIATIGSSSGIMSGVAVGSTIITYSVGGGGCVATLPVTVSAVPAPISGAGSVCAGMTTTLTDAVPGGVWTSSNSLVASVGTASGIVSGIAAGVVTITYNPGGGCFVTKSLTVNSLPAGITGTATLCVGSTTTLSTITTGGVWTSGSPGIASVGSASGLVSGVAVGTATITYTVGVGCAATKTVTVNPAPPGITGPGSLCAGTTIALADATPGGTWSSGATSIATVGSASGIVSGVSGGVVVISYSVGTACFVTRAITINAVPPITGLHSLCAWGDTLTIHNANPTGAYSSTVATVTNLGSGNGRLTTFAPGTSTVTYTIPGGCSLTVAFTVNPLPGPITGSNNVCVSDATTLFNSSGGGVWTSATPAIATVGSSSGLVSGIVPGTAVIRYTLPTGCKVDTLMHVNPPPSMIIGVPSIVVGMYTSYSCATPGGVWSSTLPSVATIGATTGLVHGLTTGTAIIRYTLPTGCSALKALAVNPLIGLSVNELNGAAPHSLDIIVSPNPARGAFAIKGTIEGAKEEEEVWIELTDMLGQTVYSNKTHCRNGNIDEQVQVGEQIANGMYLLHVHTSGDKKVVHIVISR